MIARNSSLLLKKALIFLWKPPISSTKKIFFIVKFTSHRFHKGEPVSFGRRDLSRKSYTSAVAEEIVQERRTSIFPAPRTGGNTQNSPKAHHISFNLSQDGVSPKSTSQFKRQSAFDPNTPSKRKPTKSTCLRLLISLQKCWNSFYNKVGACLYHCCFVAPKTVGDWVYRKTKRVGKTFGFDIGKKFFFLFEKNKLKIFSPFFSFQKFFSHSFFK